MTIIDQLKTDLLDLATNFTLGVFKGIRAVYPDTQYEVYLEKSLEGWGIKATNFANMMIFLVMKQDGTFSFDRQKQYQFTNKENALEMLCSQTFKNRKRLFIR